MTLTKEEALKAYDDLVAYRRLNILTKSKDHPGKIEIHHVIPVSMNGLDNELNKVALLAKEHFMAHVYLWIIHHDDEFHDAALCALMNMHKGTMNGNRQDIRDFVLMSEDYQQAREEFGRLASKVFSEANKGENNPHFGKHWYKDPNSNACRQFYEGEQPIDWTRGKHATNNEYNAGKKCIGAIWITNAITHRNRMVCREKAEELVSSGEWKYGRVQKPMSELGKQNIRAAQLRKTYEYHKPKNKNKRRYVNVITGKRIYLDDNDKIPDGYVKSSKLKQNKRKNSLCKREYRLAKHHSWLKETQDMANYFSEYGYEETCKKFNVSMSVESMIMRFIRARKLYGIVFKSLPGRKRKFKSVETK